MTQRDEDFFKMMLLLKEESQYPQPCSGGHDYEVWRLICLDDAYQRMHAGKGAPPNLLRCLSRYPCSFQLLSVFKEAFWTTERTR